MTQPTISAERIEEMLAGLEGLPQGPYWAGDNEADLIDGKGRWIELDHGSAIWQHFSRCDPDAMREVLTLALSALRAQAQGSEAVAWPDRCPECNLNWQFHVPAKVHGANAVRCVECKHVLYASPPVQAQPQGVMVKALEWTGKNPIRDNGDIRANSVVGMYEIGKVGGRVMVMLRCVRRGDADDIDIGSFDTFEEAKAAAQADYERRILSALASPPAPVDGGVTDALSKLVDAVSNMRVPQNIAEAGIQVMLTLGPALENARAALTASRAAVAQDETP